MRIVGLSALLLLVFAALANAKVYSTIDRSQLQWYTPGKHSVSCFYQAKTRTFRDYPRMGHVECFAHRTSALALITEDGRARVRTWRGKPTPIQRLKEFRPIKPGWKRSWKKTGVSCQFSRSRVLTCSRTLRGVTRGFLFNQKGQARAIYLTKSK